MQQNFLFIKDRKPDLVLILSGDHIYRMNYQDLIKTHVESGAAATLALTSASALHSAEAWTSAWPSQPPRALRSRPR